MKERPILMSAPMVRAIIAGRKTQTRRLVKPQPSESFLPYVGHYQRTLVDRKEGEQFPDPVVRFGAFDEKEDYPCPYGKPCDRLWVRETWADVHPLQVAEGRYSKEGRAGIPGPPSVEYRTIYAADGDYPPIWYSDGHPFRTLTCPGDFERELYPKGTGWGWWPSIHMPRWASRITLEVVSVRVERLKEISEADAKAEGIESSRASQLCGGTWRDYSQGRRDPFEDFSSPVDSYRTLWESINGPGSWDGNPWVWVVEFKPIDK